MHQKRLENDENFNFDIGLIKLDRYVHFASDVAPICLDGFLDTYKKQSDSVFLSGFGLTIYRKSKKSRKPECSTNKFLPRPYHTCKVNSNFMYQSIFKNMLQKFEILKNF